MLTQEEYTKFKALYEKKQAFIQRYADKKGNICINLEQQKEVIAYIGMDIDNDIASKIELYEFVNTPPTKYFAYVDEQSMLITNFMGEKLGTFHYLTRSSTPLLMIYAINGRKYKATYYPSSGNYCRIREV